MMVPENETLDVFKGMTALLTINHRANDTMGYIYRTAHKPAKPLENT